MATKFNYSQFDFQALSTQIYNKLASDPNITFQGKSTLIQTVIDIIAASTDMLHYGIERRAEESFFETARLDSTGILLAGNLGYTPHRNIPARSRIKITIPWDDTNPVLQPFITSAGTSFGFFSNYILNDPEERNLSFTYDDLKFIPLKQNERVNTSAAYTITEFNYAQNIVFYMDVLQAEYKVEAIANPERNITEAENIIFQEYKIDNTKFSDFYGENDIGANTEAVLDVCQHRQNPSYDNGYTRIWISPAIEGNEVFYPDSDWGYELSGIDGYYGIHRKMIINDIVSMIDSMFTDVQQEPLKICIIKSNLDKTVKLMFGDGRYFSPGIFAGKQLNIQYLETEGAIANKSGIVGEELEAVGKLRITLPSGVTHLVDITDLDATITFEQNIYGGVNFESLNSIRINAPATFASQDRLVTLQDYKTYLIKHGMSGGPAKDCLVWGEQEEIDRTNAIYPEPKVFALRNFANIVMYSVMGRLYDINSVEHQLLYNIDTATTNNIQMPQTEWTEGTNNFYNAAWGGLQWFFLNGNTGLGRSEYPVSIREYEDYSTRGRDNIKILKQRMDNMGIIAAKHLPLSPIIQFFELAGKVYLSTTASIEDSRQKINNAIYQFLETKIGFNVPILKTDIYKIVTQFPEVKRIDFQFVPMHGLTGSGFDPSENLAEMPLESLYNTWQARLYGRSNSTKGMIEEDVIKRLYEWFNSNKIVSESFLNFGNPNQTTQTSSFGTNVFDKFTAISPHITEREFWRTFAADFYRTHGKFGYFGLDENGNTYDLIFFVLKEINLNIKRYILYSMLDLEGNISNFSLSHEIAAITMNRPRDILDLDYSEYALEYVYV